MIFFYQLIFFKYYFQIMLLWDVRFVADRTGRIDFSKVPISEPISCESNNIYNILMA